MSDTKFEAISMAFAQIRAGEAALQTALNLPHDVPLAWRWRYREDWSHQYIEWFISGTRLKPDDPMHQKDGFEEEALGLLARMRERSTRLMERGTA